MSTELPTLHIHGTRFMVDLRGMRFIQADNYYNCIRFEDVQDNTTESIILYDTATKNAFRGTWGEFQNSRTAVEVRLPALAELDPSTFQALLLETASRDENLLRAARELGKLQRQFKASLKRKRNR